jgi:hypothetical protein
MEDVMSEFDKLKDDAEQYAQHHPQEVKEGEQAVEKKLGVDGPGGGQPGPAASGASDGAEADRSSDQGQTGQGQ